MEETKETQKDYSEKENRPCSGSARSGQKKPVECLLTFQDFEFHTYSGLPYSYHMKYGRSGTYTKELWINRREKSKSLVWSSVRSAYQKVLELQQESERPVVERPKALGDIRESRIFTASFTSLPCWKCRKKQKKKLLCRQQDKNRRKNKFSAHAGLDNHALGDII